MSIDRSTGLWFKPASFKHAATPGGSGWAVSRSAVGDCFSAGLCCGESVGNKCGDTSGFGDVVGVWIGASFPMVEDKSLENGSLFMTYVRLDSFVRSFAFRAVAICIAAVWAVVAMPIAGLPTACADETGFESLFDGKSLAQWKANENAESWKVADGQIICRGVRSHLFYVGPDAAKPAEFQNFHFKADVLTKPNSNSGIFFHTKFQPEGWPTQGYEMQVNNSQADPVRTGSLYNVIKNFLPPAKDDTWFTQELIVKGKAVAVIVDGRVLFEFVEPDGVTGTRKLSAGTFALQAHDPGSEVHYKNIRVKRLP